MEATPLSALLERIAGEYRAKDSIYEIPSRVFVKNFALEAASTGLDVMGKRVSLPVGPAAGPHTQIAPNIVAAYLAGARVFELKTVQENDRLDIAKPCIDALNEGHNTEWSTELSLEDARGEYIRGWIAVNLLAAVFSRKPADFFFNMSVGYSLAGIKGEKVDSYIEGMREPSKTGVWKQSIRELAAFIDSGRFTDAFGGEAAARARALLADFPDSPVHSVTLSTMHGCPPDEIERIGRYLIEEKGFNTYIKLNPTLLGYDRVRNILDTAGWNNIEISRDNFEKDLQFKDALALIRRLSALASDKGLKFGIKLSNTLANRNTGSFLPGGERYMSGRALYPITVRLAAELAANLPDFKGRFSYCGGVSVFNAAELVSAGLGPLTVATDVLKPGGYLRFGQMAEAAVRALPGSPDRPNADLLCRLADEAPLRPEFQHAFKQGTVSIPKALPLFDCFAAPCMEACPVSQKAPRYIHEGGAGDAGAALCTVLADNPLPHITAVLCDHVCQKVCSRLDYEGPILIRESKLAAVRLAEHGTGQSSPCEAQSAAEAADAQPQMELNKKPLAGADRIRAAVVGAGPAGLSCAAVLAAAGARVTVFDRDSAIGGVPANTIPLFRISRADIEADLRRIRDMGVEFKLGTEIKNIAALQAQGYSAVFLGTGAPSARRIELKGSGVKEVDALSFLESMRGEEASASSRSAASGSGRFPGNPAHIVVAGGGNTALDAARAALRMPGVKSVTIVYRRTRAEMPAARDEVELAISEGVQLIELALPESAVPGRGGAAGESTASLVLRCMKLGACDASGRPSPEPCERTQTVSCDLLVSAIGEAPDKESFAAFGVPLDPKGRPIVDSRSQETKLANVYSGGDASRGPASIIAACADGRRAAEAMLVRAGCVLKGTAPNGSAVYTPYAPDMDKLANRGRLTPPLSKSAGDEAAFLKRESYRCLACDSACLRCVEVCPNRANIAIPRSAYEGSKALAQAFEILHVDYLCNECGNCGRFCPYEGEPYRGKPTLFSGRENLLKSQNAGFAFIFSRTSPAKPGLAVRSAQGASVDDYSYDEWTAEASEKGGKSVSQMLVLASAVYSKHSYLIDGGENDHI